MLLLEPTEMLRLFSTSRVAETPHGAKITPAMRNVPQPPLALETDLHHSPIHATLRVDVRVALIYEVSS
jgi:hypothetical protein